MQWQHCAFAHLPNWRFKGDADTGHHLGTALWAPLKLEVGRTADLLERVMKVKRVIANIETTDIKAADAFYRKFLGLDLVMDHGWLRTYASASQITVQVSFASHGGSNTPVPELSIEVDDLAEALRRVKDTGTPIEGGPISEPWGVRRFYVRDPLGKLVNILQHEPSGAP